MQNTGDGAFFADTVVRHGAADEPALGPAIVAWRDGVITHVAPCRREELGESARALGLGEVRDLGDLIVAPAWVNAHTHLAMSALRGLGGDAARRGNVVEELWFAIEAALTADDVRAFARMGALECLLCGTGAVFDHYYHAGAVAQALRDVGLHGVVAPTLQDLAGPGASGSDRALDDTCALDDDHGLARDGVVAALGPHASDTVSEALWTQLVQVAEARELPVHVHVAQSLDEVRRAHAQGYRSPMHRILGEGRLDRVGRTLLVHGIYVSADDLRGLDPARFVHVHCPASQAQFAHPAELRRWAGVPIALGTDAGACNDAMNVQRELLLLGHADAWRTTFNAELHRGLDADLAQGAERMAAHRDRTFDARRALADPWAALQAVWAIPGRVHPRLQVGRIQPGSRANLAVWDKAHPAIWPGRDPLRALAYGDVAGALHTLIVGGRAIGEPGDVRAVLQSDRAKGWAREASERLTALLARCGRAS